MGICFGFLLGISAGLLLSSMQDFYDDYMSRKRCREIEKEIDLHNGNLNFLDSDSTAKEIDIITTLKAELKILSE